MSVDFSAIINDFLTAELGEEVRDSLVAIAEALQTAINGQLVSVTDDLDNRDNNTALLARTIADILYGGSNHANKTPKVQTYWSFTSAGLSSFGVADMPRNTYTRAVGSQFTDSPSEIASDEDILIERVNANIAGNVSIVTVTSLTASHMFNAKYIEDQPFQAVWRKLLNQDRWVPETSPFGTDDVPVNHYASVLASAYNGCPDSIPSTRGIRLEKKGINPAGTRALVYVFPGDNGGNYYVKQVESGAEDCTIAYDTNGEIPSVNAWETGVEYAVGTYVLESGKYFKCKISHTSSVFADDFDDGDWKQVNPWRFISVEELASIVKRSLHKTNVRIDASNKSDYFTDANNAPSNTIYLVLKNAELDNMPPGYGYSTGSGEYTHDPRSVTGWESGTLITTDAFGNYSVQIFITGGDFPTNNAKVTLMYFRAKYGPTTGWSAWHTLSDRAAITAANVVIRKKLIAPYEDGDGQPTAEDTGIENHQRIIGDPFYFNNFNDAPLNSIVQVDLDCDASVMANNPLSGRSCLLQTWCWSFLQRHAIVQFCIGLTPGAAYSASFFFRYGYAQSLTEFRWTNWSSANASAVDARLTELEARVAALEG